MTGTLSPFFSIALGSDNPYRALNATFELNQLLAVRSSLLENELDPGHDGTVRVWYLADMFGRVTDIWNEAGSIPHRYLSQLPATLCRFVSVEPASGWMTDIPSQLGAIRGAETERQSHLPMAAQVRACAQDLKREWTQNLRDHREKAVKRLDLKLAVRAQMYQMLRRARARESHDYSRRLESFAADNRTSIEKLCRDRCVTTLVHFTRESNLPTILRHGLLGQHDLVEVGVNVQPNDKYRMDRCRNAVCLSVTRANSDLMKVYSMRYPREHWIVLLLDARLLWELDCAFYEGSAASPGSRSIGVRERARAEYLERMFGGGRDATGAWRPANRNAEVLVLEPIHPVYISAVHFESEHRRAHWQHVMREAPFADAEVGLGNHSIELPSGQINTTMTVMPSEHEFWRRAALRVYGYDDPTDM